jgi:preprotein translocase subunit SecD
MGRGIAAVALLSAFAAACSSGASAGSSRTPDPPQPTSTYTQLGALAISRVLDVAPHAAGTDCPDAYDAFPKNVVVKGQVAVCDDEHVYLTDVPAVNQDDVEATTVSKPVNGDGWSVLLQLTRHGAGAFFAMTQEAYEGGKPKAIAFVYDGAVISAPTIATDGINGGLAQIGGLAKGEAREIARALYPS